MVNKNRKLGDKCEKRVAKAVKGRTTIASGAIWHDKEDVRNEDWLMQCKATRKDTYILKLSDINKLIANAKKTNRDWAFVVEFCSNDPYERMCYIATSYEILDENLGELCEYKETILKSAIRTDKKQVILSKDDMDNKWLEDENTSYVFTKKDKDNLIIVFLNETDFYKMVLGKEKIYGCQT